MNSESPEWKQKALDRFRQWLEALPDDEPTSPEDASIDLYTVAEELTALKQEMRTLGRTTAQLAQSSQTVSNTLKEELPMLLKPQQSPAASGASDKDALQKARRSASRPFLIELGDLSVSLNELRDRKADMKWPFYVSGAVRKQLMRANAKPLEVLLMRVNALLSRHALAPMAVFGEFFDATRMNAAGISRDGVVSPGCISAVVRQGFVCGEEILRFAEVIVEENES